MQLFLHCCVTLRNDSLCCCVTLSQLTPSAPCRRQQFLHNRAVSTHAAPPPQHI